MTARLHAVSLCTGYGGLDMAVTSVLDARVIAHCEHDLAPSTVLAHRWPDVPNLHDITDLAWADLDFDVLTAGYPCQPFSLAGRRKGTADERHLWPSIAEGIRRARPRLVLLENVAGHRSMGLDTVLGDLATDGYDATWTSLRAADIGAPHGRERLFIAATDADLTGSQGRESAAGRDVPARRAAADADGGGLQSVRRRRAAGRDADRRDRANRARDTSEPPAFVQRGRYEPAIRRWEHLTRPAPSPTEANTRGGHRLNPWFVEWMMGLPAGHVCAVPGISRNEQLKMLGNGVVPQQAAAALRWLLDAQAVAA